MKRNRSIRTLPLDKVSVLNHPVPEPPHEKFYFGEEVSKESSLGNETTYVLSSNDSLDTVITGIRDLGTGKSSSSSLSWGEDYKSEASRQVRDELERMDRVLRGEEPIPSHYDKDEYKEWLEFFPNLCVLGTKFGTYCEHPDICEPSEQFLFKHPDGGCDKSETPKQQKSKPKRSVMKDIYQKSTNYTPPKSVYNKFEVKSCLEISPLGGTKKEYLSSRRQPSSRSLISSHISSSRWLKEDRDYNSLPFLINSGKSERTGRPRSILKNSLVLPPIEASSFRSISATPRRENKSLSALSVNGLNGLVKDRLETSKLYAGKDINSRFKRKSALLKKDGSV